VTLTVDDIDLCLTSRNILDVEEVNMILSKSHDRVIPIRGEGWLLYVFPRNWGTVS
jgi:hypothetical protein